MLLDLFRALRLVPRDRRWQWAALVPLAVVAAALESVGAGIVLALGTVAADPAQAAAFPFVSRFAEQTSSLQPRSLVIIVSAGVLLFYVLRGVLLTLFIWAQETVVHRTAAEVAARLFRAYVLAPYVFHLRRNSATLIQTAGQSVDSTFALHVTCGQMLSPSRVRRRLPPLDLEYRRVAFHIRDLLRRLSRSSMLRSSNRFEIESGCITWDLRSR